MKSFSGSIWKTILTVVFNALELKSMGKEKSNKILNPDTSSTDDLLDKFFIEDISDSFKVDLFSSETRSIDNKNVCWSIAWSDIMMTMFIFFLIMYIYQATNQEFVFSKGSDNIKISDSGVEVVVDEDIKKIRQKSFSDVYDLSKKTINDTASVELINNKAVRITLSNDLLFESGQVDLKFAAKKKLREVAMVLKQTSYIINVVGHTDDIQIHTDQFPTNWELSAIRACVVARYLSKNYDIPANRFFISGYSSYQPVKLNNSIENRFKNRRVEIIIIKEKPGF
jgi:chemotaxis protein MotB